MLSDKQMNRINTAPNDLRIRLRYKQLLEPDISDFYDTLSTYQKKRFDRAVDEKRGTGMRLTPNQISRIRQTPQRLEPVKQTIRPKPEQTDETVHRMGKELYESKNLDLMIEELYGSQILPLMKKKTPYSPFIRFIVLSQLSRHRGFLEKVDEINQTTERKARTLINFLHGRTVDGNVPRKKRTNQTGVGFLSTAWERFKKAVSNSVQSVVRIIGSTASNTINNMAEKLTPLKLVQLLGKTVFGVVTDNPALIASVGADLILDLGTSITDGFKKAIHTEFNNQIATDIGTAIDVLNTGAEVVDQAVKVAEFL